MLCDEGSMARLKKMKRTSCKDFVLKSISSIISEVFGLWTVREVTKNPSVFRKRPQVLMPDFTVHGTVMQLWGALQQYCRAELLWSMPMLHEKHRQAQIAQKSQLARSWLLQNSQVFVSTEHCLFICCCDSMPTSPEVQNYKTPLPARDATQAATLQRPVRFGRSKWWLAMQGCKVTETPEHGLPANRLCSEVPQKYFSKVCTVKTPTLQFSENRSRGKVQEVDVCSELVIFYLWLESCIYIYIILYYITLYYIILSYLMLCYVILYYIILYYIIYYVDLLLNLMLTVWQSCFWTKDAP